MKVYLLTIGEYSDYNVDHVCASREAAEEINKVMTELYESKKDFYDIEEEDCFTDLADFLEHTKEARERHEKYKAERDAEKAELEEKRISERVCRIIINADETLEKFITDATDLIIIRCRDFMRESGILVPDVVCQASVRDRVRKLLEPHHQAIRTKLMAIRYIPQHKEMTPFFVVLGVKEGVSQCFLKDIQVQSHVFAESKEAYKPLLDIPLTTLSRESNSQSLLPLSATPATTHTLSLDPPHPDFSVPLSPAQSSQSLRVSFGAS